MFWLEGGRRSLNGEITDRDEAVAEEARHADKVANKNIISRERHKREMFSP